MENQAKSIAMEIIKDVLQDKSESVTVDTQLVGSAAQLDSMGLVELCLALEDKAEELGFEFDWTSETAMSKSRGMFRTAGSLATEFVMQMKDSK